MMKVNIGFQTIAMYGELPEMQKAWMDAEEMGADRLYTSDHLNAFTFDTSVLEGDQHQSKLTGGGEVYEGTTVQAAMAVTTHRAEVGCVVHANSYRNPNMMAYIAGTIDHLSRGRFILGMGTGFFQHDYESYGYPWGPQTSRAQDMARDIPIIKSRLAQLQPQPLRRIPIMIASMGEKIGMRVVAEHADIWHLYGPLAKLEEKIATLKNICREIGRDPAEIEIATNYTPNLLKDADPDKYLALGITHLICLEQGPVWDRGLLREILAWRKALG